MSDQEIKKYEDPPGPATDTVTVGPTALGVSPPVKVPEKVPEKVMTQSDYLAMAESFGNIQTTKEQQALLFAQVDEDDVEIRPDGLVYLPWMGYVKRLRDAFGTGWGLMPQGKPVARDGFVLWAFYLVIQGRMAAYAVGECEQTSRMTYGDCLEGAKSNALMRLCKNMGISLELWQPSFIRRWKEKYAVQDVPDEKRQGKFLWRRRGAVEAEPAAVPATPPPPMPVAEPLDKPMPDEPTKSPEPVAPAAPQPADPCDAKVEGTKGGTEILKVESVSVHKPGPKSRAKNPSYRILSVDKKTYYTFDKTLATIANEAKKSGASVKIEFEVTPYGFKALTVVSGPFDQPLPIGG